MQNVQETTRGPMIPFKITGEPLQIFFFRCTANFCSDVKLMAQCVHFGSISRCENSCHFRLNLFLKVMLHLPQVRFACFFMCSERWLFSWNFFSQCSQS